MFPKVEPSAYIIVSLSLCIIPFLQTWKGITLLAFTALHLLLKHSFMERRRFEIEKLRLPANLLIFAFLCKLGLPLPRALQFIKEVSSNGCMSNVIRNALHHVYMGRDPSSAFEGMGRKEEEIGRMFFEVWEMGKTEHPYTILRIAGKGYKETLLVRAESLENRRAILNAAAFFLPIFFTSLISPHFTTWDLIFTILLALNACRVLHYVVGW